MRAEVGEAEAGIATRKTTREPPGRGPRGARKEAEPRGLRLVAGGGAAWGRAGVTKTYFGSWMLRVMPMEVLGSLLLIAGTTAWA